MGILYSSIINIFELGYSCHPSYRVINPQQTTCALQVWEQWYAWKVNHQLRLFICEGLSWSVNAHWGSALGDAPNNIKTEVMLNELLLQLDRFEYALW